MKLLLDTNVFLWIVSSDSNLPSGYRRAIINPDNDVFLSTASGWEAIIKSCSGKLPLPTSAADYLARMRVRHQVSSLVLDDGALPFLANLPMLHRDPFDRILIAQALQHDLTLVTVDKAIHAYDVPTLATE